MNLTHYPPDPAMPDEPTPVEQSAATLLVPLKPLTDDAARVAVVWGGWDESVKSMVRQLELSRRQVERHIEAACRQVACMPARETKLIIKGLLIESSSNPIEASRRVFDILRGVSPRAIILVTDGMPFL